MKLAVGLLLVVFNACLASAESLTTLQDELKLLQDARQTIQGTASLPSADKLRKLFADETIKRLYNKYPAFPSATWESYAADLEKELKSVERKYKVPRYSPGADESMIEIIEPTLAQLKKEYEVLGKKDTKRKELKKKIDDLQIQLENHKSQAKAEKEGWEKKSAKIVAERDAALAKIAEKVNGELDAFVELHYLMPIKKLREREVQERKEQVAKKKAAQEASRKLAGKRKLEAWAIRKKGLESLYRWAKEWYLKQLEHNALTEVAFEYDKDETGGETSSLSLGKGGEQYWIFMKKDELSWPSSMDKDYAHKLLESRIVIFYYEDPDAGVEGVQWSFGKKVIPDDDKSQTYDDFYNDDTPLAGKNDLEKRKKKIHKQFIENERKGLRKK